MIVERYHDLLDTNLDAAEGDLIRRLVQGEGGSVNTQLTKLFARYKGPYPIGSLVRLGDQDYVVIEQPDNNKGKIRPIVAQLKNGELTDKRDLRKETVRNSIDCSQSDPFGAVKNKVNSVHFNFRYA